jgi:hypothetical protein
MSLLPAVIPAVAVMTDLVSDKPWTSAKLTA